MLSRSAPARRFAAGGAAPCLSSAQFLTCASWLWRGARSRSGLVRARAAGKKVGCRPRRDCDRLLPQVRALRGQGLGIRTIARRLKLPPATVADWASENVAAAAPANISDSGAAAPTAA